MQVRDKRDLHFDPKETMHINPKLAKAPPDEVSVDELLLGVKQADLQQGRQTGYGKYVKGQKEQAAATPTEAGNTGFASFSTAAQVDTEDVEEDDALQDDVELLEGLDVSTTQDIGTAIKVGLRQFGSALYPGWKDDAVMVQEFARAVASLCGVSERAIIDHLVRRST